MGTRELLCDEPSKRALPGPRLAWLRNVNALMLNEKARPWPNRIESGKALSLFGVRRSGGAICARLFATGAAQSRAAANFAPRRSRQLGRSLALPVGPRPAFARAEWVSAAYFVPGGTARKPSAIYKQSCAPTTPAKRMGAIAQQRCSGGVM